MPIAQYDYRRVVIDTSPLIDAMILEFRERAPEASATILGKSPLHPCLENNPKTQGIFRELLSNIGEILITSHVIGEIRSDRHVPFNLHGVYWQCWLDFLNSHNVSEKLITLREMNDDKRLKQMVCEVGPTDAGVVALASREECLLLTHDERLYRWLGAFPDVQIELVKSAVSY